MGQFSASVDDTCRVAMGEEALPAFEEAHCYNAMWLQGKLTATIMWLQGQSPTHIVNNP